MPQRIKLAILLILMLSTFSLTYSQGNNNLSEKVSDELISRIARQGMQPCMIYFAKQERFNTTIQGDKSDKASFVFEKLKMQTESQNIVQDYLLRNDRDFQSYFIVNAIASKLNYDDLLVITDYPEVAFISFDSPVENERTTFLRESAKREATPEWGLIQIKADSVWDMGFRGEGVVVGGQDTGYDWTHPALKTKYRGYISEDMVNHNYNWHDAIHEISPLHNDSIVDPSNNPCGLDVPYPCDDSSHGTHTMGTMIGLDEENIIGVAPEAKWIGVRNMERGWGQPSTYIEGFEWFLAPTDLNGENPDPDMAPHVINNSWSCPTIEGCDSTNWAFMEMAINNLRHAGVFVVVSAGNNGNACGRINTPPSMFDGSFAVAATKIVDTVDGQFIDDIAGYSGWGPVMVDSSFRLKPDIAAPGSRVRSSVPGNNYSFSNGTSMAGPHVAGVVALIISANPSLAGKVDAIEEIIQLSADPKTRDVECPPFDGNETPNFIFGHGRINALEAVKTALLYTETDSEDINVSVSGLLLFPNPASDQINISWDDPSDNANVKIMDLKGNTFHYSKVRKEEKISIYSWPYGIYLVKALINNRIQTQKLVIH